MIQLILVCSSIGLDPAGAVEQVAEVVADSPQKVLATKETLGDGASWAAQADAIGRVDPPQPFSIPGDSKRGAEYVFERNERNG